MVGGPHRRGASTGTQITAAINIAIKTSRKNNAGFLRKHKAKVNNEIRKKITKLSTYQTEISDDQKKISLSGC